MLSPHLPRQREGGGISSRLCGGKRSDRTPYSKLRSLYCEGKTRKRSPNGMNLSPHIHVNWRKSEGVARGKGQLPRKTTYFRGSKSNQGLTAHILVVPDRGMESADDGGERLGGDN